MASKNDKAAEEADKGQGSADGQKGGDAAAGAQPSNKARKLRLILGIAGIGLAATGVGGYFVVKTMGSKTAGLAAKAPDASHSGTQGQGEPVSPDGHADKAQASAPVSAHGEGADQKAQAVDVKGAQGKDAGKGHEATHGNSGAEGQANQAGETKAAANDDKADDNFGDTVDIPRMELNLGNPLENRFLRFGLSLEYHGGEEQKKELSRRMPQIRDVVISIISRKTRVELLTAEGKEGFRKQLKNTLNELLQEPVTNVYFTEFLVE